MLAAASLGVGACDDEDKPESSARSPEAYCEAFYSRAAPLHEKYAKAGQATEEEFLGSLATVLATPGDLAVVFDGMIPHAPEEIEAETVAARDAFRKVQEDLAESAADPAGGLLKNLVAGATASGSFQRVGDYLQAHCPTDSAIAKRYIKEPVAPAPAEAPEAGDALASQTGSGRFNVVTNGRGFAIVRSLTDISGDEDVEESTVTTYDATGNQLAEIPSGELTGECGAADVMVGGKDRIILTQLLIEKPAEGIEAATTALDLTAWDAETGEKRWTAHLISPTEEEVGCDTSSEDGRLSFFASTHDGRWGVYEGEESWVIDLSNGRLRRTREARALGNYLLEYRDHPDDPRRIIDPSTGEFHGKVERIDFNNEMDAAPGGMFDTQSEGSSPPAGISSDGDRLIAIVEDEDDTYEEIAAYDLPGAAVAWTSSRDLAPYIAADAGGVLVVARNDGREPDYERELVGLDDKTGEELWTLPDPEDICGITSSQLLLSINGQLAVIDTRTGKQLSYSEPEDATCPVVLPGGIGVMSGSEDPTQEHGITITQVLDP